CNFRIYPVYVSTLLANCVINKRAKSFKYHRPSQKHTLVYSVKSASHALCRRTSSC
ncbi:unnamed protein product, partial [Leptidea sinapis]